MAQILVVEDDEQFRDMLLMMLSNDHHHVIVACDGQQGLKQCQHIRPDLIITDILMPHVDGIEFIMELTRRNVDVPIIAVSGGRRAISAEFNLESAKLMGVKATLSKPFSREALRKAISQALM